MLYMRRVMYVFALLSLFAGPCFAKELPSAKPAEVGVSAGKLVAVDDAMAQLVEDKRIAGGVVIILRHGKVCFHKAYGKRDADAGPPMKTDTIFRIYSMSKAITTAGALVLVDEGKLKPTDPVAKYVPELADMKVARDGKLVKPARAMIVADLMRHTSGFTYGDGPPLVAQAYKNLPPMASRTLDDMAASLAKLPLAFDPGSKWNYSISVDVLGLVIERAAGMPLDKFLKQRIFDPLDMKDTGFYTPKAKHNRLAALYQIKDDGLLKLDKDPMGHTFKEPVTLFSGGGGLVSTSRDYTHFLAMVLNRGSLFGKRILRPQTVGLMTRNQLPDAAFPIGFGKQVRDGVGYGFGFAICVNKSKFDAARPVGECGWGGYASTHYWLSPKDDLAVVTLEQRIPYTFETEFKLKPLIYAAIVE